MGVLWLYQIPPFLLGVLVVGLFLLLAVAGLRLTRGWRRKLAGTENEFANYYLATIAVMYAVLLGLIAVASWENYSDVEDVVSQEAIAAAGLYQAVELYPPAHRERMRQLLRQYVSHVVSEEWPAQRRGVVPKAHAQLVRRIARDFSSFQPADLGQQAAYTESLGQLRELLAYRRMRLDSVESNLPGLMWFVVLAGAAITLGMTFFFWSEESALHRFLNAALAVTLGLMIFMIFSLDRPLVGSVSVEPSAFQEVLETMGG
jgi:Protein of unknown function (DUF4239)